MKKAFWIIALSCFLCGCGNDPKLMKVIYVGTTTTTASDCPPPQRENTPPETHTSPIPEPTPSTPPTQPDKKKTLEVIISAKAEESGWVNRGSVDAKIGTFMIEVLNEPANISNVRIEVFCNNRLICKDSGHVRLFTLYYEDGTYLAGPFDATGWSNESLTAMIVFENFFLLPVGRHVINLRANINNDAPLRGHIEARFDLSRNDIMKVAGIESNTNPAPQSVPGMNPRSLNKLVIGKKFVGGANICVGYGFMKENPERKVQAGAMNVLVGIITLDTLRSQAPVKVHSIVFNNIGSLDLKKYTSNYRLIDMQTGIVFGSYSQPNNEHNILFNVQQELAIPIGQTRVLGLYADIEYNAPNASTIRFLIGNVTGMDEATYASLTLCSNVSDPTGLLVVNKN